MQRNQHWVWRKFYEGNVVCSEESKDFRRLGWYWTKGRKTKCRADYGFKIGGTKIEDMEESVHKMKQGYHIAIHM